MAKILTCIDGSVYADSVVDHAGWAAGKLSLPVELLQVLGRREAVSEDRSGRIIAGARRKLLEELAELDAARIRLQKQESRLALEEAQERLAGQGIVDVTIALRQGDLLETVREKDQASLIVLGKRGEAADFATLHLGSNLERIVRVSQKPILIASRVFRPISRALIAFDGSEAAKKVIREAETSPLFTDISFVLLSVAERPDGGLEGALNDAVQRLRAAGRPAEAVLEKGRAEDVIGAFAAEREIDLLAMGAYGQSRLKSLMIGSTTSALIRACQIPVAVYR